MTVNGPVTPLFCPVQEDDATEGSHEEEWAAGPIELVKPDNQLELTEQVSELLFFAFPLPPLNSSLLFFSFVSLAVLRLMSTISSLTATCSCL